MFFEKKTLNSITNKRHWIAPQSNQLLKQINSGKKRNPNRFAKTICFKNNPQGKKLSTKYYF
jgi:hypothetical protein